MTGVFVDHLSLDVVVAYADGELSLLAYQRASAHLAQCPMCADEVAGQTVVQQSLKAAEPPPMPGALFDSLRSIPLALPAPPTMLQGAGPVHRHGFGHGPAPFAFGDSRSRGRRFRVGAGALMAGLAVGAVVVVAAGEHPAPSVRFPSSNQSTSGGTRPVFGRPVAVVSTRSDPAR